MTPEQSISTRCCKCGNDNANIVWVEHKTPHSTAFGRSVHDNEHLLLTCNRCRFEWKEKPLDKGTP